MIANFSFIALLLSLSTLAAGPEADPKLAEFLARIGSDNAEERLAARQDAARFGAPAVAPLAKLLLDKRQDVAVAARAALDKVVHHAGRPGAGAERAAVAAELEKLLAADQAAAVRREAVYWLGFIAGDGSVPAVAGLIDDADPHVKENARLALERIPGMAAIAALGEALKRAGADRKPALLYSLAKKGAFAPESADAVLPILMEYAREGSGEIRLTSLEGLARVGAPAGIAIFNAAMDNPKDLSKERLFSEFLRLADNLKVRGEKAQALALYRRALAEAPQDYLREHALLAACPAGESENIDLLIAGVSDSGKRSRALALRLLNRLQGGGVLAALRKAYVTAPADSQPALLMAMAERDRNSIQEVLDQASQSSSPELKITALDLLSRLATPEMAPAYLEVAEKGLDIARPIAIKGYLQVARARLEAGDKGESFSMYQKALKLAAASNEQRTEALRGAIATAHSQAIDLSSSYLNDSILATDAAEGVVKLAARLEAPREKEAASKYLNPLLTGNYSEEIKDQAVEQLRRFGMDPQAPAKALGYLVNWRISTPIQDGEHKGFDEKYYPEEQIEHDKPIDFEGVFQIGPRRIRWRKLNALSPEGKIDLVGLFRRSENVLVYGYAEIQAPGDQEVVFRMGSDDGIACWLNGKRIHASNVTRKYRADEDAVLVRLQKGVNRILVKVTQRTDDWGFSFRILTLGAPLDLRGS